MISCPSFDSKSQTPLVFNLYSTTTVHCFWYFADAR